MLKNIFLNLKYKLKLLLIITITSTVLFIIFKPKHFLDVKYIDNSFVKLGFKLKEIKVLGNNTLIKEDIVKNIHYHDCKNLFCINLSKSKRSIEQIPWVKNVSLNLLLPSRLEVKIKEEIPNFILKKNNKFYLLNSFGETIVEDSFYESKYNHLLILTGLDVEKNIEELSNLLKSSPNLAKNITQAIFISNRRWSLIYKSKLLIELPEKNPEVAFKKIDEIDNRYGLLSNKLEKIDLRIKNRMIIKLKTNGAFTKESKI